MAAATLPAHGQPLEVLVEGAAVLRGRVVPAEVARDWGPPGHWIEAARLLEGRIADHVRSAYPAVVLVDPDNPGKPVAKVHVRADGSFRLHAVPTGTWDIVLELNVRTSYRSSYTERTKSLARITDLRAGEEREITIDARHLVKPTLRGLVQLDGFPARAERLGPARGPAVPTRRLHAHLGRQGQRDLPDCLRGVNRTA